MRSLSFVLPAYNEEPSIGPSIHRCIAVGERLVATRQITAFEIIAVDDGSNDGTRSVADAIARVDARVRTLHHPRNRGYGAALKTGLLAATMDRVFFTDADLQFDVDEVEHLLHYVDRYGIVAGYRAPRRDPLLRRINGAAWSRLVDLLFDTGVRDVDCAFKVFDRRIFDRIDIRSLGAFVNTEILVRARATGATVLEVPVSHFPRTTGRSSGANPQVIARALAELTSLYGELRAVRRVASVAPNAARASRVPPTAAPTDPM